MQKFMLKHGIRNFFKNGTAEWKTSHKEMTEISKIRGRERESLFIIAFAHRHNNHSNNTEIQKEKTTFVAKATVHRGAF